MALNKETPTTMLPSMITQIEVILTQFLKGCDIVYPRNITLDLSYRDACYSEAKRRGLNLTLLGKSLDVAIAIGDTGYQHLQDYSTRIFIAIYTAIAVHIDDSYHLYAEGMEDFVSRLLQNEPQRFEALDNFASVVREVPHYWGIITSNFIVLAGMDFLTSMVIEGRVDDMEISLSNAPHFPRFTRRMTGVARAYSTMVFPAELDPKIWIQVIPDLMHYVDHTNDLLSFYKEELEGEDNNFISISAKGSGNKIDALKALADETIECYKRGSRLLQPVPAAWEAYRAFCVGYVGCHVLSVRYRLDELFL